MKKEEKELAVKSKDELVNAKPDFLKDEPITGMEEATTEDYVIPRLQIAQAMSPEIEKQDSKHIPGLQLGQLFNTVTKEVYGEEINVVPLWFFKSRVLFKPRNEGGGVLCTSSNGKTGGTKCSTCEACEFSKWGSGPDGSIACTEFKNYPSLLVKDSGFDLISVSMKSTGIKVAKRWNTLIRLRKSSTFSGIYKIKVVSDQTAKGKFYNFDVDNGGWVSKEQYEFAKQAHDSLRSRGVKVDIEGLGGEEPEPEDAF